MIEFLTCILHDYMAHDTTTDFFKNSNFFEIRIKAHETDFSLQNGTLQFMF
jgi:hypothetical protein